MCGGGQIPRLDVTPLSRGLPSGGAATGVCGTETAADLLSLFRIYPAAFVRSLVLSKVPPKYLKKVSLADIFGETRPLERIPWTSTLPPRDARMFQPLTEP